MFAAFRRLLRSLVTTPPAPVESDPGDPFDGRSGFPLTEELDLHGLPPRLIPELVVSYLEEARGAGFRIVRIVHGKGTGFQRERVRGILAASPLVETFDDAKHDRGGWGATMVRLRRE